MSVTDRYLNPGFLRFTCVTFIALSAGAQLVSFLTYDGGPTIFGTSLGGDFTGFYTGGTLLNRYPAGRLYDFGLQSSLYHELFPKEAADTVIPFVHPPFVALAFRPFAALPYPTAFLVWLLISVGLYLSGLRLLVAHQTNLSRDQHSLAVLLAIAFSPFLLECAFGGQLSTVGFFALVFGLHTLGQGRAFLGGFLLGLGLYKPPLVLLVAPFLLVSRQARAFAGFLAAASALGLIVLLVSGGIGVRAYLAALHSFGGWVAGRSDWFPSWKFVDAASLLAPLAKSLSIPPEAGVVVAACILLPPLLKLWRAYTGLDLGLRRLVWAATLTSSLILNLYTPIYDSILAVPGALWTADYLERQPSGGELPGAFKVLLVLLMITPLITHLVARTFGVQIYSLVLTGLACYQLHLALSGAVSGKQTLSPGNNP